MSEQFRSLSERVNRLKQPMYAANAIIREIFFSFSPLSLSLFLPPPAEVFTEEKRKKKKRLVIRLQRRRPWSESSITNVSARNVVDGVGVGGVCETAGGKFSLPVTRITRINFHGSVFGHGRRSSDINNFHSELALARVASFRLSDRKMRYAAEMRRTIRLFELSMESMHVRSTRRG